MKAYELIADPKNWTQGAFARTKSGNVIGARQTNAVCWCAIGALEKIYGLNDEMKKLVFEMRHILKGIAFTIWHDDSARTHAEVIALLKQVEG